MAEGEFYVEGRAEFGSAFRQDVEQGIRRNVEQPARASAARIATAIGGAFAARQIIQFGQRAVNEFRVAEQATLKLTAAFESQETLGGHLVDQFIDLSAAMQRNTRFADEETQAAAATLAQFRLTSDELETLIPLVADLASRQGIDLTAAASQAGRAILGQGRALKSVGIDFQDTGTRAGNLTQLVEGLRSSVGGFAEREGKTGAGQAAILANQFGEMQETLGGLITEGLGPALDVLTPLVAAFQELPGPIQTTIGLVVIGTGVFIAGGLAVNAFKTSLEATGITAALAGTRIAAMAGPIGIALAAMTAFGIGISFVGDAGEELGHKLADEFKEVFRGLAEDVRTGDRSLQEAVGILKDMGFETDQAKDILAKYAAEQRAAEEATESFGKATNIATSEVRAHRLQLLQLSGGFIGIQAAADAARQSEIDLGEAQDEVAKLLDRGKQGTDKLRDAKLALRDAQREAITSSEGVATAVFQYLEQTDKAGASTSKIKELTKEYGREAGVTGGALRGLVREVQDLIREHGRVPSRSPTKAWDDDLQRTLGLIESIGDELANAIGGVGANVGGGSGGGGRGGGGKGKGTGDTPPSGPSEGDRFGDRGRVQVISFERDGAREAEWIWDNRQHARVRVGGRKGGR